MSNNFFTIDEIPKGSLLEKYSEKASKTVQSKELLPFLKDVFLDCLKFLIQKTNTEFLPQITLKLVHTHEQFEKIEKREFEKAKSDEIAKYPTRAFVIHNKFMAEVYVDVEFFISLINKGYPTFMFVLIHAYMNEILHILFPKKIEQEIYDLQCPFLETFLGIKLSKETKNLNLSNYYSQNPNHR